MGTDIHVVVERRWRGKWIGVSTDRGIPSGGVDDYVTSIFPMIGRRNYAFFGRLAGVRCEGPDPNGLPHDVSDLALMIGADQDWGHSHGWLPLKDFAFCWCAADTDLLQRITAERLNGEDKTLRKLFYVTSVGACDDAESYTVDDFRVVFWFDN